MGKCENALPCFENIEYLFQKYFHAFKNKPPKLFFIILPFTIPLLRSRSGVTKTPTSEPIMQSIKASFFVDTNATKNPTDKIIDALECVFPLDNFYEAL